MTNGDIFAIIVAVFVFVVFLIVVRILAKHINRLYGESHHLAQETEKIHKDVEELPGLFKKQLSEEKRELSGILQKNVREAEQKTEQAFEKFSVKEKEFHQRLSDFEKDQQKLVRGIEKRTVRLEARLKGVRFKKPKRRAKPAKVVTAKPKVVRRIAKKAKKAVKAGRPGRPKKAKRGRPRKKR